MSDDLLHTGCQLSNLTTFVFSPLPPPIRGVDDILPIMSYVIVRSALPQLASETALMEEFIQEG